MMASACVIKFAFKSSIFVSTETKYASQINLDVSRWCGLSAGTFQKGAVHFSELTLLWKPSLADPLAVYGRFSRTGKRHTAQNFHSPTKLFASSTA